MIFFILIILLLLILGRILYLYEAKKYTAYEIVIVFIDDMQAVSLLIANVIHKWWLRRQKFQYIQNIMPYENTIKALKICKYFKFAFWADTDHDIAYLHFNVLSLTQEYRDNLKELSDLLQQILQDFYIERLGNLSYPLVYAMDVQENGAVFCVAKNAYGNEILQERILSIELSKIPGTEELEDD